METNDKVPTAARQIYEYVSETRKLGDRNINRASSTNNCVRQRWYTANGYEGDLMAPRTAINFLFGDLTEALLLHWIKKACVGDGKLYSKIQCGQPTQSVQLKEYQIDYYKQETLNGTLGGISYTAHADAFGRRNLDGKWELIEIKSCSSFSYSKFIKDGPVDYLPQCHAVMHTEFARQLGVTETRFFYFRKETGHIYDQVVKLDPEIIYKVAQEFAQANAPTIPDDPYPLELKKGKLQVSTWKCEYCPYLKTCKPGGKIDFVKDRFGNMKPQYTWETKDVIREMGNGIGRSRDLSKITTWSEG